MLKDLQIFAMAQKRMDWVAERQEVLARNIANADTPRYRAQDLEPLDFKTALTRAEPLRAVATHASHVSPEPTQPRMDVQVVRTPYENSINGNSVVLEEQMIKVSEARGAYELAANLFQKHKRMFSIALGKGGA